MDFGSNGYGTGTDKFMGGYWPKWQFASSIPGYGIFFRQLSVNTILVKVLINLGPRLDVGS